MKWVGVSILCNSRTPPYVTVINLLPLSYSRYLDGVASLQEGVAVAGFKTLYICIKKTSYEYEVSGGYQLYVTVEPHLMSQ
jgi:hypothetical protein